MLKNSYPSSKLHQWTVEMEQGSLVLANLTSDPLAGFTLTVLNEGGGVVAIDKDSSEEKLKVPSFGNIDAFATLASRFVLAIRERMPLKPDLESGARVQTLLDAVA